MTQSVMGDEAATVLIAGAGIGGVTLALALNKKCGLPGSKIEVYEQARAFTENAGGAMGLYANGLRVLREISPDLLASVREAGYDYIYRRWQRHDGTEVACAHESELTDDPELQSIGIRRWKLQKALCDAAAAAGIVVRFGVRTEKVEQNGDGTVNVTFGDGTSRAARVVFGADGIKSKVREAVVGPDLAAEFTGVTCMMGAAKVPRPVRGICFPSSSTTKNHACYYPTGDNEQIFQLYFPAKTVNEAWGVLTPEEGTRQCTELAEKLRADGWDDAFTAPLKAAETVIRVGIYSREPLDKWAAASGRIILLGDAAHPPVPYIGQGAMMAMEDVGVLSLLLQRYCCAGGTAEFSPTDANLFAATEAYQAMRIPRTRRILGSSHKLGATQQKRADSWMYNAWREWSIRWQVARHGTLPIMKPGAAYNFVEDVAVHVTEKEGHLSRSGTELDFTSKKETQKPADAASASASPSFKSIAAGVAVVAVTATALSFARRR